MKKSNVIKTKSFEFAIEIISLYKILQTKKEYIISNQLLRSGTSIGANVSDAMAGQSKKDFITKMSIASKEACESAYWLELLDQSQLIQLDYSLYQNKVQELIRLLTSIVKTSQINIRKYEY